jgi:hypothetical protein
MAMLRIVAKTSGGEIGPGWNLIVLHHTDCGINCLVHSPDLLAKYFGVAPAELHALAITDPHKSVVVDVAALKANPQLPGGFLVSGLVYDVATGRIEILLSRPLCCVPKAMREGSDNRHRRSQRSQSDGTRGILSKSSTVQRSNGHMNVTAAVWKFGSRFSLRPGGTRDSSPAIYRPVGHQ